MKLTKILLFFALTLTISFEIFAKEYEVRLSRSFKIGQDFEYIGTGENVDKTIVKIKGREPVITNTYLWCEIVGKFTVLKIDKLNRPVEFKLLVSNSGKRISKNGVKQALLQKGTLLFCKVGDKKQEFLIDSVPVDKDIYVALKTLFSSRNSKTTDDDIFGTSDKKKIGDSWSVNIDNIFSSDVFKSFKFEAKDSIKGTTKLDKLIVKDGFNCLHLSSSMNFKKFHPSALPSTMDLTGSTITINMSGLFPVDTTLAPLNMKMKKHVILIAKGVTKPGGPNIEFSKVITTAGSKSYKLLK